MASAHDLPNHATGTKGELKSKGKTKGETSNNIRHHLPKLKHLNWWVRVTSYIFCVLVGQTVATLLGRLYFDKGGNSKWMATLVQSAGFPLLIPLLSLSKSTHNNPLPHSLPLSKLTSLYFILGLILTVDNLLYSYGLLYLPVSTYSLLCATQLAFNAVSSYFLNGQKFTILILNSLVLLSVSACLLAINVGSDDTGSTTSSRGKYAVGFLCTLGASGMYALNLSLIQLSFEKLLKSQSFVVMVNMLIYPAFVATIACVVGLFGSGEWRKLRAEMADYEQGRVSYVMNLGWTAIAWQVYSVGMLGLVVEVSSLFSNVIGTLGLPLVPVFAVVFFHDKMNGVKVIALVLAVWGFVSYVYQHYLDDVKAAKVIKRSGDEEEGGVSVEIY